MASENTFKESKLKSAFQGVVGGLYAAVGESSAMGIQTAGYVYDRVKLAKDQAVQGIKAAFS